jgi:hypothetical protein
MRWLSTVAKQSESRPRSKINNYAARLQGLPPLLESMGLKFDEMLMGIEIRSGLFSPTCPVSVELPGVELGAELH